MARNLIYMGQWSFDAYLNDTPKWQSRILDIRNRFRSALASTSWTVSDIMTWPGLSGVTGAAFMIRHLSASVPTGREWFLVFPGPNASVAYFDYTMGSNNGAIIDDYFIINNNGLDFGADADGAFGHHYNEDSRQGTDLFTCEFTATFTGTPTVSELMKMTSPTANETQATVIAFTDTGGGNCTIKLRLKRGAKVDVGDAFSQTPTAATISITGITYESLYDMGFDDWDTAQYATPLTASGGAGVFTDGETVNAAPSTASGVFRREADGNVYLVKNAGEDFAVSDVLTGASSGATRNVTAVLSPDFTDPVNGPQGCSSPYSAMADFMPLETRLKGIVRGYENLNIKEDAPHYYWILDDQTPFLACFSPLDIDPGYQLMSLQGEIIVPYLASDTRASGSLYWNVNTDANSVGTLNHFRLYAYTGDVSPGTVDFAWSMNRHEIFNLDNMKRESDGLYNWDLISLSKTDEYKGHFDPNVLRQGGPVAAQLALTLSGPNGPFIKFDRSGLWPWVQDEAPIFAPRWGSEPAASLY
jgi:hypothetical protein